MMRLWPLAVLLFVAGGALRAQDPGAAYERRGHDVEASYTAFVDRLERYQSRLRDALERDAPDLAEQLVKDPPKPTPYGYQLLPRITPGKASGAARRPQSVPYSWRRTQEIIDAQLARLADDERNLDVALASPLDERRPLYEPLVARYAVLDQNQDIADQHLKHNWFWQKEVAGSRERFARLTALHDAVVEREGILSTLAGGELSDGRQAELEQQAEDLRTRVRAEHVPTPPDFITVWQDGGGGDVLRVPVYTDITDPEFVDQAVAAIEATWQLDTGDGAYRIQVELRPLSPESLYDGEPPTVGEHIDLSEHVARFPTDGAVLTTGANRTHAYVGRFVAFGPGAIAGNTVAHEFGHILGFTDRYLRGARDWGEAGFEIVEIVPDADDIMGAAGHGDVLDTHFEELVRTLP